jgi:hypothetical protein
MFTIDQVNALLKYSWNENVVEYIAILSGRVGGEVTDIVVMLHHSTKKERLKWDSNYKTWEPYD